MRESENVSFKQEQSSVLPMKHTGNQLQFNLCPMYEQFATEYVLICSPIRLTHTIANSKDGSNEGGLSEPKIEEDEHAGLKMDQHEPIKNTFLVGNEVMLDWNSSKSEVKSTILEVPTGTRSSHNEDVVNVSSHQETECIQNTCPGECELRYWNTLKSKRISSFNAAEMVAEIVAETERCHAAVAKVLLQLMETNDVMETNDSEDVLDRDKEVCMKIHNDKTTHSRGRMFVV